MTQIDNRTMEQKVGDKVSEEREPTVAGMRAWRRDNVFLPDTEATAEEFRR